MSKVQLCLEELEPRLTPTVPAPDHIVIVIEENDSYSDIIGSSAAPYINSLAGIGALMTNSYAIEHPSQPNYLDLFSGSNQGVTDNSVPHTFSTPNLASELIAAGLTFGGYSESMPSVGYTGANYQDLYVRKHNPWVNFSNVPSAANMPFSLFPSDFSALPTVSIVVPNQQNNMHDGPIETADTWLEDNLDPYVQWAMNNNSLLIFTFDEDDGTEGNRIATIFVGPMVQPGEYAESMDHFDLLRTLEDMYGLTHAGASATADPITDIWVTGVSETPLVSIVATDATASEPGQNIGRFTIHRTGSTAGPLTVTYSIAGTAGNGSDYKTLTGTVTIAAGAVSKNVTVTPLDNATAESVETVVATIGTSTSYRIGGTGTATVKILDNDSATTTLVATGSDWKYRDIGSNQGTAWRAASFNDSTWASGSAELGYGDGDESTVVSFGPDSANKYVTTYFRQAFNVTDKTAFSALQLRLLRDDGAVVYLNGIEVFRSNMPTGAIGYTTLASAVLGAPEEASFVQVSIDPAKLVNGVNVLAVEIHQADRTSSDISFDLELIGMTANPVLVAAGAVWKYQDNGSNQETNWRAKSFNDSTWKSGSAQLGYSPDEGDERTVVGYGPDANNKYITTYFRTTFYAANVESFTGALLRLLRDDGAVVYLNGTQIFRSNMPSGTITYTTLASTAVGGASESTYLEFSIDPTKIVTGKNVLAVELHQASGSSSDLSFDLELIGNT